MIIGRDLLGRASRLVTRGAEEAARSVGSILRPAVEEPDEALCRSLCDLGPEGHRAQQFLLSAAEQLNRPGSRAGEHASYAVREALNALIALGGSPPRGMRSGVKRVLQRWSEAEGDLDSGPLTEAVAELRVLEEGPGPNETRLERAITDLARQRPTRVEADLLKQFMALHEEVSKALHNDATVPKAIEYYKRAIVIVGGLFGSMVDRIAPLAKLAAVSEPCPSDVERLKKFAGDDRHLAFFFSRIEGPAWMKVLLEEEILLPPDEGVWAAGPYIGGLATQEPDLVAQWLRTIAKEERSDHQAVALIRIARQVGPGLAAPLLTIARDHLGAVEVRFQLEAYLAKLADDELSDPAIRSLVQHLLVELLTNNSRRRDSYWAAEIFELALEAMAKAEAKAWLLMLAHRLREVAEPESDLRLRIVPPLSELSLSSRSSPLELAFLALSQAMDIAEASGIERPELLEIAQVVPDPLRSRLIAQYHRDRGDPTDPEAREFLARQIREVDAPGAEHLALLREAVEAADPGFVEDLAEAIGEPPALDSVEALPAGGSVPEDLRRAHRWLVGMPDSIRTQWSGVDHALDDRVGMASNDGVLMRIRSVTYGSGPSPIPKPELQGLSPVEAARRIGSWKPPPDDSLIGDPTDDLSDLVAELVTEDPTAWLDADPAQVVRGLASPRYIGRYFRAIKEKGVPNPEQAAALVEAVGVCQSEPWEIVGNDLPARNPWQGAVREGVELIGALGSAGVLDTASREAGWTVVTDAIQSLDFGLSIEFKNAEEALGLAINRFSSAAIAQAFALGHVDNAPTEQLLSLLDQLLTLAGPEGALVRAMIAPRLPWLRQEVPQWFSEHEAIIFGREAPDDLGGFTFRLYLETATQTRALLIEQRDRIVSHLGGEAGESARAHLLHGLLWQVDGYSASQVTDDLIAAGRVSMIEASRWLGWALAEAKEVDPGPIEELWREVLSRDLRAEEYVGWGWLVVNEAIDDQTWLQLTLETARKSAGQLDEADRVAERAEKVASDSQVYELITLMLGSTLPLWELERVGAVGLSLLAAGTGGQTKRTDLKNRLLERGFHEAADL